MIYKCEENATNYCCGREIEKERERQRDRDREREREKQKLTARNSFSRSSMLPLWMVKRAAAIWLMALARQ